MNTEYSAVHYRRQSQVVKNLAAMPPDTRTPVFPLTLLIESVHLGDLSRLVIASNECDAIRISYFQRQEEKKRLNRIEASVYKVTW